MTVSMAVDMYLAIGSKRLDIQSVMIRASKVNNLLTP